MCDIAALAQATIDKVLAQTWGAQQRVPLCTPAGLSDLGSRAHPTKLSAVLRVLSAGEDSGIGVLLCRGKHDEVMESARSRSLASAPVAQYQLQLPDKRLIAARMHELLALHDGVGDE